jgi:hypothetical protein
MKQKKMQKKPKICQLIIEIDVTYFDNLTRLWQQKSANSMDSQMTDEGTEGAPTCFL